MEKPIGIPTRYSDYARLMLDLQVLAFQGDMTRVGTFMVGHEMGGRAYPELGFGDQHHSLTHHQGDTTKIEKVIQINIFHARLFQYFLEKMRSVPDGDGSLLDHSLCVYGSPLGDGNMHLYKDLPVVLVAGRATGIQGDRHVRYPENTPMANLYLTLLDKLGIHLERFGDSTRQDRSMRVPVTVLLSILLSGITASEAAPQTAEHVRMRLRLASDSVRFAATAAERLLDAVIKGDQRAVRELLRQRADVNTAQPDGSTVLMLAVERNHPEIADLLIRAQANVNAANEYGRNRPLCRQRERTCRVDQTAPGGEGESKYAAPFG